MGKILSLFRKEPSSEEILTKLETQIKDLEGYTFSTRETQRKFAGRFLVASIGTYVIAFVVFYFYFFPPTWRDRVLYSTPLLLFPVLIILLRYCFAWYFDSKIDRNNRKLIRLRNDKKKVLQNVMDKETYKVALEILNTFGDRSMRLKASHDLDSSAALNASLQMNSTVSQLRTPVRNTQNNRSMPAITQQAATPSAPVRGTPVPIGFRPGFQQQQRMIGTPNERGGVPLPTPVQLNYGSSSIVKKTPFPVIDARKQNVMEKMMDFIISDGPSNRFAMICSSCCGHNGMALQEDFEYVAFKCAFCATLNPARKIRPKAQGLSLERKPIMLLDSKAMESTSEEEEEEDEEVVTGAAVAKEMSSAPEVDGDFGNGEKEEQDHSTDGSLQKTGEENNNHQGNVAKAEQVEDPEPKDMADKKTD